MRGFGFAVVVAGLVLGACAPPVAQESAEVAAMDGAWEAAFGSGDASGIAALYAEDARLLPPNGAMSSGRAVVEAAFGEMIAAGQSVDLTPVETMAAGDLGTSVGTYVVTDAEGTVLDRGKYIETLRKVGGAWQITNDTWNSDLPAGPAGTQLIIAHRVEDEARWNAAWQGENSRAYLFAANGAPSVSIFRDPEDPKHRALLVDVVDMDAFTTWVASDESKAAKAEDGVLDQDFVIFTPLE